jgi:arylsulfatase A-like enzyme
VYKSGLFCGLVRNTTLPPTPAPPPAPAGAKNVMLIVADDMNADLPMYGNLIVHAPNLQRIADSGVTFNQAHVQIAYCCPSRNSFMSGRRPDTTRVWNFLTNWRQASLSNTSTPGLSDTWIDLPQWFKRHGFWTSGVGKTWHNAIGYNPNSDWSELSQFPVQFDVSVVVHWNLS